MKAKSALPRGGTPRWKRQKKSLAAFSTPQLSSENGGLETTTSNFFIALPSSNLGLLSVSPHSTRAPSLPCRNMFIRQSAHTLPFDSCPKREKSLSPTSSATRISSDPEPHAGSQIRAPFLGWSSLAIRVETSGGV